STGLLVMPSSTASRYTAHSYVVDGVKLTLACKKEAVFFETCVASPQWIVPPGDPWPPSTVMKIARYAEAMTLKRKVTTFPLPLLLVEERDLRGGFTMTPPNLSIDDHADAGRILTMSRDLPGSSVIFNPMPWEYIRSDGVVRAREFLGAMKFSGVQIAD